MNGRKQDKKPPNNDSMKKEICLVKPKEKEKPLPFYVKTYEREILNGSLLSFQCRQCQPLLNNSRGPRPQIPFQKQPGGARGSLQSTLGVRQERQPPHLRWPFMHSTYIAASSAVSPHWQQSQRSSVVAVPPVWLGLLLFWRLVDCDSISSICSRGEPIVREDAGELILFGVRL